MRQRKTIPWNFSEKQKEYLKQCKRATYNFAEGAVRSGKTVCNILAFSRALEETPDRLHLATGVTIAAAKLNLGDCNGFGLEHLFRGRCRWGRYHDNPALFVGCRKPYARLTKQGIQAMLRQLGEKTSIHTHPHKFRRTLLTDGGARGVPLQELQRYAGHAKPDTTMLYVSVQDESVRSSFRKLIA